MTGCENGFAVLQNQFSESVISVLDYYNVSSMTCFSLLALRKIVLSACALNVEEVGGRRESQRARFALSPGQRPVVLVQ